MGEGGGFASANSRRKLGGVGWSGELDGEVRLPGNVHGPLYTDATSTDLAVKWRFMSGMMTMKAQAGTNAAKMRAVP